MRYLHSTALLLTGTLLLGACSSPTTAPVTQPPITDTTNPSVSGVSIIGASSLVLNPGQTQQITAQIAVKNGASTAIGWTSSNPAVASVDANGKITAVGIGSAMITATSKADATKTSTLTLTVQAAAVTAQVQSVSIVSDDPTQGNSTVDRLTVTTGTTLRLRAVVNTTGGAVQTVTWKVSDTSFASIQVTGNSVLVTFLRSGSVDLTAISTADPNISGTASFYTKFGLTGSAQLSGNVVQANRSAPVAGSTVKLFQSGLRFYSFVQTVTDDQGHFSFNGLPAGKYDLQFAKSNYGGSEIIGLNVQDSGKMNLKIGQFVANDPYAPTNVPKLQISKDDKGTILNDGSSFVDNAQVKVTTTPESQHQKPMRYYILTVGTFDAQGNWIDSRDANGVASQDPGYIIPGSVATSEGTGVIKVPFSGLKGDLYLQVVGLDFNYNRVSYLIPIKAAYSAASPSVTAPTDVSAVAYTLAEPINYLLSVPGNPISAQSVAIGTNSWVTLTWNNQPAEGFKVYRASSVNGPYNLVAVKASESDPQKKTVSVSDLTPNLGQDQDYYYKVEAQGVQPVASAPVYTHVLPAFRPTLLSPAEDAQNVGLTPDYTLHNSAFEIGATGSVFDVRVADSQLGSSYAWLAKRLQVLKGTNPAKTGLETQVLSNLQGKGYYYVYRDSNAPDKNAVGYNNASNTLTLPHQYDLSLLGSDVVPLQPNRRYSWLINKAYAFKRQNDLPTNPIVAYSIYSDPDGLSTPIVPGGTRQEFTQSFDFTTKP
ncbi:hypothetical protein FNU79_07100 [Deinococcus detaillensis]|uniref:BIG2 domain-containing protein n=1 Tax=Deinococcus detaillensis TaxID=2592048 RepID=A0A553V1T6_9DEIO|nr:Ig-like domain-containing protein [Deinococcus detaillensis]TSA86415.1 hypothetical protein FNU79_07100 [Deinococcus detaillensis]